MDRAGFLRRLGLLAAAPVMVGWTKSLENVWYPTEPSLGGWAPIRKASRDFNHEDVEAFLREIEAYRGIYINGQRVA